MNDTQDDHVREGNPFMLDRRKFLIAGAGVAAASLLPHVCAAAKVQAGQTSLGGTGAGRAQQPPRLGNRRLGALEVSSIGLGVQNMSRKYETTVPYRPEMINVIRAAFDHGVTFFDAAEAYGPFEVERILGEGVAPFRDRVVIATKFGWNVDQETGERRPGLNIRPEHIKRVVEGPLKIRFTRPGVTLLKCGVKSNATIKVNSCGCGEGFRTGM